MPQTIWRTIAVRQFLVLSALCGMLLCISTPSPAQDAETTFIDIPRTENGDAYRDAIANDRLRSDLAYVDETNQDFLSDTAAPTRPVEQRQQRDFYLPSGGGNGVFIVVALFVIALFLILKFGAGGTLLRGDPKNTPKKKDPKESWGLSSDDIPDGDILGKIKAMTDRKEALILLLRYCLLRAADATDTNFRRADTEREALGRLPNQWPRFPQLRRLLMQTELVHYGGRDIDDESYRAALKDGAEILIEGGQRGR